MPDYDENDFESLSFKYEMMFGERITRGYGMPEDDEACCSIIRKCIDRGEPIDLHRDFGYPEDAVF